MVMRCGRLLTLLAVVLWAGTAAAQTKPANGFDRLKTLVGEWQTPLPDGKTGRVTYRMVSNGSALLETIESDEHGDGMITVYHPDGDSLLATHYCAAGNQPRMRAKPVAANASEIAFHFVDVSNRGASQEVMRDLVVRFEDADHFTQEWTSEANGKKQTAVFHLTRKK